MGVAGHDLTQLRVRLEPQFARVFSPELNRAYSYVDRLCLQLCFRVAGGCQLLSFRPEHPPQILARIGVAADAAYLVNAVLDILCEHGFAVRTAEGVQSLRPYPPDESDRIQREARGNCEAATPIFELIARCHRDAVDFVMGRKSGLATVFPRGDTGLWERLHTVDRVMSAYADLVPPLLEAIARPRMRILEIGGGVGAVLRRCGPTLGRIDFDHYRFTDVGQSFLQSASRSYGGDERMSFARVDIDLPLHDQGLKPASFDVVIAVNVLHVAKHLSASLRELLRVLKPGGCMIIAEGSPPDRSRRWPLDLVFAFLRGWWDVVTDPQWRPFPGFLLPSQWEGVLRESGFSSVDLLPGERWFSGPCRGGAILARKIVGNGNVP